MSRQGEEKFEVEQAAPIILRLGRRAAEHKAYRTAVLKVLTEVACIVVRKIEAGDIFHGTDMTHQDFGSRGETYLIPTGLSPLGDSQPKADISPVSRQET